MYSETSAHKIQTPGNNPEASIQNLEHGESLKSRKSWYSAGPIITMNGRITASDQVDSLGNEVHPVVRMFPNDTVFQDGNLLEHTTRIVESWFGQHEDALQHLPRPAQSPDILEPLWSVLESGVRSRFPPP